MTSLTPVSSMSIRRLDATISQPLRLVGVQRKSSDLDTTANFYRGVLGLETVRRCGDELVLKMADYELVFSRQEGMKSGISLSNERNHIAFEASPFAFLQISNALEDSGQPCAQFRIGQNQPQQLFFQDPDGYHIKITEMHNCAHPARIALSHVTHLSTDFEQDQRTLLDLGLEQLPSEPLRRGVTRFTDGSIQYHLMRASAVPPEDDVDHWMLQLQQDLPNTMQEYRREPFTFLGHGDKQSLDGNLLLLQV